jgi:hypothetical protein
MQISFDVVTENWGAWENGLKEVLAAYNKEHEGVENYIPPEVYETRYGAGDRVYIRLYFDNYAYLDKLERVPSALSKVKGEKESMNVLKTWASSFSNWESRILRMRDAD